MQDFKRVLDLNYSISEKRIEQFNVFIGFQMLKL